MKRNCTHYILSLVMVIAAQSALAQWSPLSYIEEPLIFSEIRNANGSLIVTAFDSGVYRSDDNGATWFSISDSLPINVEWEIVEAQGNNIFVGSTNSGQTPYKSEDLGETWSPMNMGFLGSGFVSEFVSFGTDLYACGSFGMAKSADQGQTWNLLEGNGLPNFVNACDVSEQGVFATAFQSVYRSTNGGADFENISAPSLSGIGYEVYAAPNRLFVHFISLGNVYYTDDYINWTECTGLPDKVNSRISHIETIGSSIFACGSGTFYRSDDGGATFAEASAGISNANFSHSIAVADNGTLVGSTFRGIYISTDNGNNWTPSNEGLPNKDYSFADMLSFQDELVVTDGIALYKYADDDDTWTEIQDGFPVDPRIFRLVEHDDQLFGSGISRFIKWDESNDAWIELTENLLTPQLYVMESDGQSLYTADFTGMYRSTSDGESWQKISPSSNQYASNVMTFYGAFVLGGFNSSKLYRAHKIIGSYTSISDGLPTNMDNKNMAANSSGVYLVGETGIYFTNDVGDSWERIDEEFDDGLARQAIVATEEIVIVSIGDKIYFSPTDTINWQDISENLPESFTTEILVLGNNNLYATDDGRIWKRSLNDFFTDSGEKISDLSIQVFPNPTAAEATLVLEGTNLEAGTLSLSNANGQLVHFEKFAAFTKQLVVDLTSLPSGVYFVEISDGTKKWAGKISKE